MNIRPGGAFSFPFFTESGAGNPEAADALPTGFMTKAGAKDTGAVITVSAESTETGMYYAQGTVPTTYLSGTVVAVVAKVMVGGAVAYIVAGVFVVQSLLRRESFAPSSSTLQYLEDDGATPLAGLTPLTLTYDNAGNITKR